MMPRQSFLALSVAAFFASACSAQSDILAGFKDEPYTNYALVEASEVVCTEWYKTDKQHIEGYFKREIEPTVTDNDVRLYSVYAEAKALMDTHGIKAYCDATYKLFATNGGTRMPRAMTTKK
jgi:hypothetical protein